MQTRTEADFIQAQRQWAPLLEAAQRQRNPLLIAVASKSMALGLNLHDFQAETGLNVLHLAVLVTDKPGFAHLLDEAVPALSQFLEWPPIAVKAMAGQVLLADFYTEAELNEQASLMASRRDTPGLKDVPKTVAVFAGVLACRDGRRRKVIRDVCADGPPERH